MKRQGSLLLAGEAGQVLRAVAEWLTKQGYQTDVAAGCAEAIEAIDAKKYDVVLIDTRLADGKLSDILAYCRGHRPQTDVVMILGRADVEASGETIHAGAFVLLTKPTNNGSSR
jgi:two-component system response regulator HydG